MVPVLVLVLVLVVLLLLRSAYVATAQARSAPSTTGARHLDRGGLTPRRSRCCWWYRCLGCFRHLVLLCWWFMVPALVVVLILLLLVVVPLVLAGSDAYTACGYEFPQNLGSHSWSVFLQNIFLLLIVTRFRRDFFFFFFHSFFFFTRFCSSLVFVLHSFLFFTRVCFFAPGTGKTKACIRYESLPLFQHG